MGRPSLARDIEMARTAPRVLGACNGAATHKRIKTYSLTKARTPSPQKLMRNWFQKAPELQLHKTSTMHAGINTRGFSNVPWRKRAFGSGTKYGF